jgi:ribose 5-phosphate isomerase
MAGIATGRTANKFIKVLTRYGLADLMGVA